MKPKDGIAKAIVEIDVTLWRIGTLALVFGFAFMLSMVNDLDRIADDFHAICEQIEACEVDDGVYREQILPAVRP